MSSSTYTARAIALTATLWLSAFAGAATPPPIFVLNSLSANVSVIDPVTFKEIKRIPTGKEPHHLYLTPDGKSIMVANAISDTITMIDPRTAEVQRTIKGMVDPYQLRFSPDMKWFITAANRLNHVDIYRWEQKNGEYEFILVKRIPTGKTPSHIAVDSKSKVAYVSIQEADELMAIDLATQTPLWTISTGKTPADVYLAPDDKTLLIGMTGGTGVEVYDVSGPKGKLVKTIPTGEGAHAFRSQGDGQHVFVGNRTANTISRIDWKKLQVVDTYKTLPGPDCMELMADGKTLISTARWAGKMIVIDLDKKAMVKQVPVGKSPHGVWTLEHAPRE